MTGGPRLAPPQPPAERRLTRRVLSAVRSRLDAVVAVPGPGGGCERRPVCSRPGPRRPHPCTTLLFASVCWGAADRASAQWPFLRPHMWSSPGGHPGRARGFPWPGSVSCRQCPGLPPAREGPPRVSVQTSPGRGVGDGVASYGGKPGPPGQADPPLWSGPSLGPVLHGLSPSEIGF